MNTAYKRRIDDLQASLSYYAPCHACQTCGAPYRLRHLRLWLVVAKEVPRCSGCNRLLDPEDGDRPIQTEKLIHLVDGDRV